MEQLEKIKERKEEVKKNLSDTYCDCICDYNDGYICDVIAEISDNHVDIYYSDLFEWCKGNFDYVNDWIAECGSSGDIIKDIQGGQYKQISDELYENMEEMLLLFAYDYIFTNEIILNDEQLEELEKYISDLDNNDQLEDIISYIEDLQNNEESEAQQ